MPTTGPTLEQAGYSPDEFAFDPNAYGLYDSLPDVSGDPSISSIPGYSPSGVQGIDTAIDSSGDEGYADSSGSLGGGNSVSSNDPNSTLPAPGSPVASTSFHWPSLEDFTKIATVGAQLAVAIEGPSGRTPTGRQGQSAPVGVQQSFMQRLFGVQPAASAAKPSFFQSLLGAVSGQTSGANPASASGQVGFATIAFIGVVVAGLGFLVWKAVK